MEEPVQHRRDSELPRSSAGLGDLGSSHRLWLVDPREQLLANRLAVRHQIRRQFSHGHPVHAGTALELLHSLQRRERVRAFDHSLHQRVVDS